MDLETAIKWYDAMIKRELREIENMLSYREIKTFNKFMEITEKVIAPYRTIKEEMLNYTPDIDNSLVLDDVFYDENGNLHSEVNKSSREYITLDDITLTKDDLKLAKEMGLPERVYSHKLIMLLALDDQFESSDYLRRLIKEANLLLK